MKEEEKMSDEERLKLLWQMEQKGEGCVAAHQHEILVLFDKLNREKKERKNETNF